MKRHANLASGMRYVRNLMLQEKVNFSFVQTAFLDLKDQFEEIVKRSKPMSAVPEEVRDALQYCMLQRKFSPAGLTPIIFLELAEHSLQHGITTHLGPKGLSMIIWFGFTDLGVGFFTIAEKNTQCHFMRVTWPMEAALMA